MGWIQALKAIQDGRQEILLLAIQLFCVMKIREKRALKVGDSLRTLRD